jgi:tetratricopeptide (TPR) repeat protein
MKKYLIILLMALLQGQIVSAQSAKALYEEGMQLKNDKKVNLALEKFKKAIELQPNYPDALYECGWCQNDLKNYNSAIDYLRKARVGWSTIPKVYFELGYAFDKTNAIDSALKAYQRCLELKPDYSLALKQLGYMAYNRDDNKTALDYFTKYEAAAKTEIQDYLYWYRKGFVSNAVKEFANAKIALKKSVSYKNDYPNTYLELGFASSRLKTEDNEAIGYYKKAMELDPNSHISYNGIGEVYRDNKKNIDSALWWYQKTLTIKANERKACFGIGYCLNSKGDYNNAIPMLKKAIEGDPNYTAAYVEIGYSLYQTGKMDEAIVNLNKAISLNALNENARVYLVSIYVKQKNKTMAQKIVDELKKLSSKHTSSMQAKVDAM